MYKVIPFQDDHVSLITDNINRKQLPYHEYSFIDDIQLKEYYTNCLLESEEDSSTHAFSIFSGTRILGFLKCVFNPFDSDNFGFRCYRITDLLLFSDDPQEMALVISALISTLEETLASYSLPFHLGFSLNNNIKYVDKIFNCLQSNDFYYIHTLLTFSSQKNRFEALSSFPEDNLSIRLATESDVDQVSLLAQKSFKYSRFHIDPYLDDMKASHLLKTSAVNSILHGYVDVMYIAEINNKVVGYYSGKKRYIPEFGKTVGDAVISAVDIGFRGLGIFSKLDVHLLNWFADNTDFSEMGTYLVNLPVHKTWIKKGLELIRGSHQFSKFCE